MYVPYVRPIYYIHLAPVGLHTRRKWLCCGLGSKRMEATGEKIQIRSEERGWNHLAEGPSGPSHRAHIGPI